MPGPDLPAVIADVRRGVLPSPDILSALFTLSASVCALESSVLELSAPCSIVGDVHGQLDDLLDLFKIGGDPPSCRYLFLGDYVDRGPKGLEVVALLSSFKLLYPTSVYMIRGNHESRQVSSTYGFYNECIRKFAFDSGVEVWKSAMILFDNLPLSAVVNRSIFCVHGGLSPLIQLVDQLKFLDRFGELPQSGPIPDLLWSDPDPDRQGFTKSPRGAGYLFGYDAVRRFLWLNSLSHVTRAHQLCMEGYNEVFEDRCVSTVWSAPNYCNKFRNLGSILSVDDESNRCFITFAAASAEISSVT